MRSKVAPWVVALLAVAPLGGRVQAQRAGAVPAADSSLFAGTPEEAARRWADQTRAVVAAARRQRWAFLGNGKGERGNVGSDPDRFPFPLAPFPQAGQGGAELGIAFRGRFELKLDRLQNQRCTAGDIGNPVSGCQPGFPTPFVDQQFSLKAGGVVSQRIHLDLDYDSEREFSANNDIRVWYEGQEGEALQRVEVGNVTLDAPGSRFITAAIPANSFGVQAKAQFGALEVRSILAQQRGSSLRTRVYTVGERVTQPVDFELRDLDFEPGRFFFVVNPKDLLGYPDLDVLNLAGAALSPLQRPVSVRVYRLRALGGAAGANPNLGGINAVALRIDSPQRVGPLPWELLVEGRDYYLDPSALWLALAARVGTEDFLAVSYLTASGDTVGTFPAVGGGTDTLELIYEPRLGPEVPTFPYEMRNAYRLGGPDVTRSSLRLVVSLNHSERPLGGGDTYLTRLGLSLAADPAGLDEYNRVFPRERDPNGGAPVRDRFVVFPHLQPFADSARLVAGETNDSLYRTPAYLLQSQGPAPRFRLRVQYEATGPGDRSGLNLGAIQVREGSERLFVGDRQLIRGRDYEVFYDVGQVSFLNPDQLFTAPVVQVRAQFEENQLFDVAPKTIVGLSSTYRLGSHGRVDALGLFQQEQSVFTRPQLGFEPQAHFIGGVSTELAFQPTGITRALDALPLIQTTAPSSFTVSGEVAVSRPNANPAGQAYVEEFEGTTGSRVVSLSEQSFQLGSRPASGRGLSAAYLASDGGFDPRDAAALVWQNGVQIGNQPVEFEPRDIDSSIVLTGTARQIERVLWLSLKPDTVGGAPAPSTGAPRWLRPHTPGPRWRSITQALDRSGLGVDLSTVEYLEFWVLEDERRTAATRGATLLLDFGTVFEDAVAPAPDSFRVLGSDTVFTGLQFVGAGRLDTEKDTLANVFNAAVHDIGILGDLPDSVLDATTGSVARRLPLCRGTLATGLPIFPLGDLGARCTRGNGLLDTEDLNGDNRLDVTVGGLTEDLVRYVFPLGNAQYFVRDGGGTADATGRRFTWRLYRISFRQDSLSIGNPDLRHIRALRLTVVAPDQGPPEDELFLALGRMRLVGAPWLKRAATPLAGLGGRLAQPHGEVIASVVSTDNQDLGYSPPPGVLNQAERRGVAFLFTSQQINEHSLRLLARDLRPGERAEAFTRFAAEGDRNFLKYRQLRVWAQGRGAGWDQGDLEFFVKVGTDEDNFYLYRTRMVAGTWEPEMVIDLQRWIALRGQIEARWLGGEPPGGAASCGGDSTALVACEGPYLVQVRHPGIAPPNLARVSEVAAGIYRASANAIVDQAEVWVDDIRLGDVVNHAGLAAALDLHLTAADLADVTLGFTRRDDRFRQLADDPSYVTDVAARIGSTLRLDKLLPAAWGVMVPLSVGHERTTADPFYLRQSDIPATALSDLRRPRSSVTTLQLDLRRTTRGGGLLPSLLLDPLSVTGFLQNGDAQAELWSTTTRNRRLRA
ncbi:MAG: cell surface protein SprA, partial [Gemmatimonadetes bacterium]|nr:cell surface protein SprA [Gemmatimonadota bacterium]